MFSKKQSQGNPPDSPWPENRAVNSTEVLLVQSGEDTVLGRLFKTTSSESRVLWLLASSLTVLGLLFIYSSSSVYADQKYHEEFLFIRKQIIYLVPAILAGIAASRISLDWLSRLSPWGYSFSLLLCFLTRVPHIGHKVGGAHRWISIGSFGFQPSEILKVATVLFVATQLDKNPRFELKTLVLPILPAFVALLIQPDFGSFLILLLCLLAIVFMHGLAKRFFGAALLTGLPLLILLMLSASYRARRITAYLDPYSDPLGAGYQSIQSFNALGLGGWFGKGLGESQQKLFFLPEAHTDFIMSVIAEELGFMGVMSVILLYAVLFNLMIKIITNCTSSRDRLLASGVFAMQAGCALVNLGVVSGALPNKGLPLPFISFGGTALIMNFFGIGLLSQISHRNLQSSKLPVQNRPAPSHDEETPALNTEIEGTHV